MGHLTQERPLKHEARICQQVILEGVVEVTFMDVTMVIHPPCLLGYKYKTLQLWLCIHF